MKPNNIFCDWITVKQTHKPHTPLYGGVHTFTDSETGEISKSLQFKTIKGLYGSSYQIRSDGETVEYSGNPSRFNQPDNVQGFDLDTCKKLVNAEMQALGLPEFTAGNVIRMREGDQVNTGAKFTRIDMTQNLKAGSPRRRDIYLQWIQTQNYPKLRKALFGLNTYFGKETESRTFRIYDKAKEMADKHKTPPAVADKLHRCGAIRFEIEYRKILKTRGHNLWSKANQPTLAKQFLKDSKPMNRKIETIDISEMPKGVIGTYAMYLQGFNPKELLGRTTFWRHQKVLRQYGIDISNTVTRMIPKKEIIELSEIDAEELKSVEG